MRKTSKPPDTLTLTGEQLDRIDQVLDAAEHQVEVGLSEVDDYRIEDALIEAEEAVDSARSKIADAVEAVRDEQEETGEAERERQRWQSSYHAA